MVRWREKMTTLAQATQNSQVQRFGLAGLVALVILLFFFFDAHSPGQPPNYPVPVYPAKPKKSQPPPPAPAPVPVPAPVPPPVSFIDNFLSSGMLQESGSMAESSSKSWWLNSGGLLNFHGGYAQTIQGVLDSTSKWFGEYAKNNPSDTDNGQHPQNIFRLVMRQKFRQLTQKVYFRVEADNLSSSVHRDQSNGLLLFNRYQDGDNLYYTGLRVDGQAIIKKKVGPQDHGVYYTMAGDNVSPSKVFPGTYDHDNSSNLLPKHVWIGVQSVVTTRSDGTVDIRLYSDLGNPGNINWLSQPILEAVDNGTSFGGAPITASGYGGIRTDFMDVSFKQYSITENPN